MCARGWSAGGKAWMALGVEDLEERMTPAPGVSVQPEKLKTFHF